MMILGIHYGHDANVGVVKDGRPVFAISEERLNRKKFHRGFPFLSLRAAMEYTGLDPDQFDGIALVNLNAQEETLGGNRAAFYDRINRPIPPLERILSPATCVFDNLFGTVFRRNKAIRLVLSTLHDLGFPLERTEFVDHHLSHAAGAFFLSGFPEALVITSDGKGDHVSHRTYLAAENEIKQVSESSAHDSAGFFYTCITSYLGFKKLRHEGKITGLAAYGDFSRVGHVPCPLRFEEASLNFRNTLFSERESTSPNRIYLRMIREDPLQALKWLTSFSAVPSEYSQYRLEDYNRKHFKGIAREHVAAFAQEHLEDIVVSLVKAAGERHPSPCVCLAGGTFGNVKLNQRIADIPWVDHVYVKPAMGDGGLGVGAAAWLHWKNRKWAHSLLEDVYLGPRYDEDQVLASLDGSGLNYRRVPDIERAVAELIREGAVVGRFTGRMEWGPRALGNRSILAGPEDPSINDILNKRLKRTEFMPFAPIIIAEDAPDYFAGYRDDHIPSRFMTITYDVFPDKVRKIPAVVHIDNTARPQVVHRNRNPSLYRILEEYKRLTGLPVLINTSFNMHEEPIVCTPDDALRAFRQGAVDVLAIENYLVDRLR